MLKHFLSADSSSSALSLSLPELKLAPPEVLSTSLTTTILNVGTSSTSFVTNGTLGTTDPLNPTRSGSVKDDYYLGGLVAGQQVQVNLNANFDTYLQLVNANTGEVLLFNDDSNGTLNSKITFTAQTGIAYSLRATSYRPNVTGNYTLSTTHGTLTSATLMSGSQSLSGSLVTTDPTNTSISGTKYYDGYLLTNLVAGQQLQVRLNSSSFDTYLQVVNADSGALLYYNDNFGDSTNSRLTFTAQAGIKYLLQATSYNSSVTGNYTLTTAVINPAPTNPGSIPSSPIPSPTANTSIFTSFNVIDAAGDDTSNTVFQDGAIRLSYNWANPAALSSVRLEALKAGSVVSILGSWTGASLSNGLINLNPTAFDGLLGEYQLRAVATTTTGEVASNSQSMSFLSWSRNNGTFAADTFNYSAALGTGSVFLGRGGTDTLNLSGVLSSIIKSINGLSLDVFRQSPGTTTNQAIFGGTAFDYLTLADGREIYFQGIELLTFSDGLTSKLAVHPNDTYFGSQWNLHVSDVESAWRFTQGASNVALVSLDTGILTAAGASGSIVDISTNRLITDATDDDNRDDDGNAINGTTTYGHGHSAISVAAATANNGSGIAGINWNSNVYVNDIYGSSRVTLYRAISDAIAYARANNTRVVFQGGFQGEGWLTDGSTQAQLEQLIQNNSDIALFSIAAGNGGPGGNLTDPNYLTSVSGVAKLETTYNNVMSVGAIQRTGTATVNGLTNASAVNLGNYSNRGSNLTLVAATDSPAMDKYGNLRIFTGTSAANPNVAGIASLVWSVHPSLTAGQVRQILTDTAMDLGTAGRDITYGNGLVNADAAVRRAAALARNSELANLYAGGSLLV